MVEKTDTKLVLLGSSGVGKTCIMKRLIYNSFQDNSTKATIGALYTAKTFVSKFGNKVTLNIWDTTGEEKYSAMTRVFYRNSKVAIVCYNICEFATWEKMKLWIRELRENEEDCKVYLCGTKKDLFDEGKKKREVDYKMALEYANGIQSRLVEVSSKTGENIEELFQVIVDDYVLNQNGEHSLQKYVLNQNGEHSLQKDKTLKLHEDLPTKTSWLSCLKC